VIRITQGHTHLVHVLSELRREVSTGSHRIDGKALGPVSVGTILGVGAELELEKWCVHVWRDGERGAEEGWEGREKGYHIQKVKVMEVYTI
jgi:hypothetical protein